MIWLLRTKNIVILKTYQTYATIFFVLDGEGAPADAAGDANGEKKEKVEDVENTGGDASKNITQFKAQLITMF